MAPRKEVFRGKKVLVTGGLGFIGSNLAARLVELGADVLLVDSLIPEYGGNLFNIAGIEKQVRVNISDFRDEHSMRYLIQDQDYLFNLAGQTSHIDSMRDPYSDLEINSKAQLFILESCRKYNPNIKVIFASTRQIYGKPEYLPVDEKRFAPAGLVLVHGEHHERATLHAQRGRREQVLGQELALQFRPALVRFQHDFLAR